MLKALARLVPAWLRVPLAARRARRHSHDLNDAWGVSALSGKLLSALGDRVQAGPFEGLRIPHAAAREHLGPYLLGTYERELHPYWASIRHKRIPLIVNVGAKFGYYAVGLHRLLQAPVIAYDADSWARRMIAETAELNQVEVAIRGACRRGDLAALPPASLVVIDCEGCERGLLQPPLPHGLAAAHIVVELHDFTAEDGDLLEALRSTHATLVVPSMEAPPPPDLPFLSEHERKLSVEETRPPQQWLICTPLT